MERTSTILDLDNDLRLAIERNSFKRPQEEIDKLKRSIEFLEYQNKRINYERSKLKKEAIEKRTGKRVKQIDKILKGQEAITVILPKDVAKKFNAKSIKLYLVNRPTAAFKNELNMISGKDFYLTIDDGINKDKFVKLSEIKSKLKKGESVSGEYLYRFKKGLERLLRNAEKAYERDKNKISKEQIRKRQNSIRGLNKLIDVANFNIKAYETGNIDYDGMGSNIERGEYPVLTFLNGSVIRINA